MEFTQKLLTSGFLRIFGIPLACTQTLLQWDWGELVTKPLYVDHAPFSTKEPDGRLGYPRPLKARQGLDKEVGNVGKQELETTSPGCRNIFCI